MKKSILSIAVAVLGLQANAQTQDISVTFSPTAQHTWWDEDSGLKDGYFVGGRIGFGFGRNFELRGVYEQSIDGKNSVKHYDQYAATFQEEKVDIKRYGAEFKVNLINKGISPYITVGSGIQEMKIADETIKNIYASGGLGIKLQLTDRIVMNLEGKNTMFNLNPSQTLLQGADELEDKTMSNWSALAGVQFYLAGRRPEEMSNLDRAYYNKYSGGFSGFSISAEPMLAHVDFDDDINLRDTYMLGGSLGFNFNKYVGLRAYYLQATKDDKIEAKWDEMAMYGADVVTRLNVARGVVPYLTLGGGYLNQHSDKYVGKDETLKVDNSSYFAKGGVGLTIPISRNIELFGEAALMYTTAEDPNNITSPDELKKHTMFNGGLRFNIGHSGVNTNFDDDIFVQKEQYITEDPVMESIEVVDKATKVDVNTSETKKVKETKKAVAKEDDKIRLTPQELEQLIEKAVQEVDAEYLDKTETQTIIERVEKEHHIEAPKATVTTSSTNTQFSNAQYLDLKNELKSLNEKINRVERNTYYNNDTEVVTAPTPPVEVYTEFTDDNTNKNAIERSVEGAIIRKADGNIKVSSLMYYKGLSGFVGANFGDGTTANVGVRGHYGFSNSKFQLVPDAYVALGESNGFGVNANVIYPFTYKKGYVINPYVGAGLGVNNLGGKTRFGTNIILGTSVDLLGGKVYVDYTARNFAKNNQIAIGYKFNY